MLYKKKKTVKKNKKEKKFSSAESTKNGSLYTDQREIEQRAEVFVPLGPGIIMIPENAFNDAIKIAESELAAKEEESSSISTRISFIHEPDPQKNSTIPHSTFFAVDDMTSAKAMALAGIANEPSTIGIVGDLIQKKSDSQIEFSGNIFVVLHDERIFNNTRRIETMDYRIVAMELTGKTPWLGIAPRFAVDTHIQTSSNNICCGPTTLCVHPPKGPDPCKQFGKCGSNNIGITPKVPYLMKKRIESGLKFKPLYVFLKEPTIPHHQGLKSSFLSRLKEIITPPTLSNASKMISESHPEFEGINHKRAITGQTKLLELQCMKWVNPTCIRSKPLCNRGDTGYTPTNNELGGDGGGGDSSAGSNPCGGSSNKPHYGRNVPKICTIIGGWEDLPPECGGWCENCEEPYYSRNHLPPGCEIMLTSPDPGICSSLSPEAKRKIDNAQMQLLAGWIAGRGSKTKCEKTGRYGIEVCTTCDANGDCNQSINKPLVDPSIAEEGEADESDIPPCPGPRGCETDPVEIADPPFSQGRLKKKEPEPPAKKDAASEQPAPPNPPPPTAPLDHQAPPPDSITPKGKDRKPDDRKANPRPTEIPQRKDEPPLGDPILIGDGSFHLEQIDLSFDCPVRNFIFARTYNSRSNGRSTLGSNWIHNWDVHIEPLTEETNPAWASPYGAGSPETTTSLMLYDGDGSVQIFYLDLQTRLYMPQTGSTDTIANTRDSDGNIGWALRQPDGHIRVFNSDGYLTSDRDRFGNGYSIEYEPTPLFDMYKYYCSSEEMKKRNETKYSRRCAVLAYLNGDIARPPEENSWSLTYTDFPLPTGPTELKKRMEYARSYLLHLMSQYDPPCYGISSIYGFRKLRPVRVTDDLGRVYEFNYYRAPENSTTSGFDFGSTPQAELLEEVVFKTSSDGPAMARVRFTYDRPKSYPIELNEMFLAQVSRKDTKMSGIDIMPSPDRDVQYYYQWPGGPGESYYDYAASVFLKYQHYYETFVGCGFKPQIFCGQLTEPIAGNARLSKQNPDLLAEQETYAFISSVADNIIQVVSNNVTESETRYETDVINRQTSYMFDHVVAQRYGTTVMQTASTKMPQIETSPSLGTSRRGSVVDTTGITARPNKNYNWQTSLPMIELEYCDAGPRQDSHHDVSGDLTDDFLADEIFNRYPLETAPYIILDRWESPVIPDQSSLKPCDYEAMELALKDLPGFRQNVIYFDSISAETHPNLSGRLYRSRLSREQLSLAQVSDPTHNDLLSTFEPVKPAPTDPKEQKRYKLIRLMGRRATIAANSNRICKWVKIIDREGDLHYYGLNYRGQVLVDALRERTSEHFIFVEKLFNADGLVVQIRHPVRGSWQSPLSRGYISYVYDEIDPTGNEGSNDRLPVYWSRRANLIRETQYASGTGVIDEDEKSNGYSHSIGRFRNISYEPLFNQTKSVEEGTIILGQVPNVSFGVSKIKNPKSVIAKNLFVIEPLDVVYTQIDYIFDYQEFSPLDDPDLFTPILDELKPWGFDWITKPSTNDYNYNEILNWQIPLEFFGEDLNKDGLIGFIDGDNRNRPSPNRIKGVPILMIRSSPAGSAESTQVTQISWAPHGKLSLIFGADTNLIHFEYYSTDSSNHQTAPYGDHNPPQNSDASRGYRGFLARIKTKRFASNYSKTYGPPNRTPCSKLSGPYQWLLPSTSSSPESDLHNLGLPDETVSGIMESVSNDSSVTNQWQITSFSYSPIGKIQRRWDDGGRLTKILRDTDGRELEVSDPIGTKTKVTYDIHGFPQLTIHMNATGKRIGETYREFDNVGHLIYECKALSKGGCQPYGSLNPNDGVVSRYEYTSEGLLKKEIDSEGLIKEYQYNERQLVIHESLTSVTFPNFRRGTSYVYNLDNKLVAIHHGDITGNLSGLLIEFFMYDGLNRVTTYIDSRGYAWQILYSGRDLITRFKQDDSAYGATISTISSSSSTLPLWETAYKYDETGRMVAQYDNGILKKRYKRTKGGLIYAVSQLGLGTSYITYDLAGRPVWAEDAEGNQSLYTLQYDPYVSSTAIIRVHDQGSKHTTATITNLDPSGLPIEQVRYGYGVRQVTTWIRDDAGRIIEQRNPEGFVTKYEWNWLGWLTSIAEQSTIGASPQFDVTTIKRYNKRGQLLELTDPGNQKIELDYDPSGALRSRSITGNPNVSMGFSYDALGRLDGERMGLVQLKHEYDQHGDPVLDSVLELGVYKPLIHRSFDELGRIRQTINYNHALAWLPITDRMVVHDFDYDPKFGHLNVEQLQAGSSAPHPVLSNWSIIAGDVWQRQIQYGIGNRLSKWWETFDETGRLIHKDHLNPKSSSSSTSQSLLRTNFHWLGDIYLGRTQDQNGRPSPFEERLEIDKLGSVAKWNYSAIALDQNGLPKNTLEGSQYCGGSWDTTQCGKPLLEISALRDIMGRIVSIKSSFGYPQFIGGSLVNSTHPSTWRGYSYTCEGFLDGVWELPQNMPEVSTGGLESYAITRTEIQTLGSNSTKWNYVRELAVGNLIEIVNSSSGYKRWSLTTPRGPGHQIIGFNVDGNTRTVLYDAVGRVTDDGRFAYLYDALGKLAAVLQGGTVVEAYAYDSFGRIAAVFKGSNLGPPNTSFAYDKEQIIAAYDSHNKPLWEASWGPLLDQLIEWFDHTGGTGNSYIPVSDNRNSVTAVWDVQTARIKQTAEYNPEGRLMTKDANNNLICKEEGTGNICTNIAGIPFGFASAWRSQVSGLIYMRNRWYSPELGQFISQDPSGFEDSYNLYAYAGFDPINNSDPFGLAASDYANEWDKMHKESTKFLEEWAEEDPHWVKNILAPALQFSMDLGAETVDLLRFGEGFAEGGWRAVGKDLLRGIEIVMLLRGARAGGTKWGTTPISFGKLGTWRLFSRVTGSRMGRETLQQSAVRHVLDARLHWNSISKNIRRYTGLIGVDIELHHWFIPQRWPSKLSKRFPTLGEGLRRLSGGRWNLMELPSGLNNWMSRGSTFSMELKEGLFRTVVLALAAAEGIGVYRLTRMVREQPPSRSVTNQDLPKDQNKDFSGLDDDFPDPTDQPKPNVRDSPEPGTGKSPEEKPEGSKKRSSMGTSGT